MLLLVVFLTARPALAQVVELRGAGSSLDAGYGGTLNFWSAGFEGSIGLGYLDGLHVSASVKRKIGRDTLRLGNDILTVRLPTDLFGTSNGLLVQGVSLERRTRRTRVLAFGGASATAVAAPQFLAMRTGRGVGIVQADHQLTPRTALVTQAILAGQQTLLQGIRWQSGDSLRGGLTVGIGANDPYGAGGFDVRRGHVDLRAVYVYQGEDFRRAAVPSPVQSEVDRGNVLLTVRPLHDVTLSIGRQNFRQDSLVPGEPSRALVNQLFASARLFGATVAGGVFDSHADYDRNISSYLAVTRDVTHWLAAQYYNLQVLEPTPSRATTHVLHLREALSQRFGLLQVVTSDHNRGASVAFGGSFASGLASANLDYQVVHTPYRPRDPFVQAIALSAKLQLGGYQLNVASFVTPDGRVNYSASASTFLYMGASLGGAASQRVRFERYLVQGRVVDESGTPIEGAAISIGDELVFSDSHGRFFVRERQRNQLSLRIVPEEFLTTGQYVVVSAPEFVRPELESRSPFVTVVLRRVPTPPSSGGAAGPGSGGALPRPEKNAQRS